MKIIGALFPGRGTAQPKASFGQTLKQQPPPLPKRAGPAAGTPLKLPTRPAIALAARPAQRAFSAQQQTTATLSSARASAHQGAAQLQQARASHHQLVNQRVDGWLLDLICKELVIEFSADPATSRVANQDLPPPTPVTHPAGAPAKSNLSAEPSRTVDGSVRAAQAVELIEKIESFIKDSRRPCIALTLNNSLGAKVEIERVGPREVALKVIGHKGPPRAEDIGRIRDEMAAHGLKVCALSVA